MPDGSILLRSTRLSIAAGSDILITPLDPYLVIVLVFMQKFVPKGRIGTLIATMFPYTVGFLLVWSVMLLVWMALGVPLGPDGGLSYDIIGQ